MLSPIEQMDALDGMVCLVDTREQNTAAFRRRIKQIGCPVERQKLSFGDYSAKFPLPDGGWFDLSPLVAVERKMSLDELCMCYTRERPRFEREFVRAKDAGAKIYLLVEDASWEAAYLGEYRSQMTSKAFVASLLAWLARYNCQILMCSHMTSGHLIRDVLYREAKERLENGEQL